MILQCQWNCMFQSGGVPEAWRWKTTRVPVCDPESLSEIQIDWYVGAKHAARWLCTLHVWVRGKGGVGSNAKARAKTSHPNHTTHTNTVWGHFCKPKWFGLSRRVWKHSWMPVFMCESSREMHVSAAKPHSHTNNQIWCRDVQPRYFPSADPGLCGSACLYLCMWTSHCGSPGCDCLCERLCFLTAAFFLEL